MGMWSWASEIAYDNPTFPDNNPIGIFDQSTKRFLFVLKNDPTKTTPRENRRFEEPKILRATLHLWFS